MTTKGVRKSGVWVGVLCSLYIGGCKTSSISEVSNYTSPESGVSTDSGSNDAASTPSRGFGSEWTELSLSGDTQKIYVSSSTGNDSNNGLTPETAVRTLARARNLMRNNYPDWMLLKAGDTFNEQMVLSKSGRSNTERAVITSYGEGARPIILAPDNTAGVYNGRNTISNLNIVGIHIKALDSGNSSGGIFLLGDAVYHISNILIEDCYVEKFGTNIIIENMSGVLDPISNISLRRNIVVDAFPPGGAHSQGAFIANVDGLIIEDNLFDHNGWKNADRSDATIFNHNIYLATSNSPNTVVRRNILTRASSHGVQVRGGGEISDNVLVQDPISILLGGGDPSPHTHTVGITGSILNNIVLEGNDINATAPRGWGINLGNIGMDGALVQGNIIAHDINPNTVNTTPFLLGCSGYSTGVGCNNITVSENITYNWRGASRVTPPNATVPAPSNFSSVSGVVFSNNDFQITSTASPAAAVFNVSFAATPSQVLFRNNNYSTNMASNRVLMFNNLYKSFESWLTLVSDTGSLYREMHYVEPSRSIASYNESIGGPRDLESFLNAARLQRKGSWDERYTANAVANYIRAGFALVP